MASTYLTRTISDGSNAKSTFSAWVKRSGIGTTQYLFHTSENTNNDVKIIFNSANNFRVIGVVSGSTVMNVSTNRVFRDTSAWYHFVVTIDLTQSTEADRVKIYVNGVQETSFSTAVIPSQNYSSLRLNNNGDRRTIGTIYDGGGSAGSGYFDGLMSHVHFTDGYAYQASTFGSTDSTTGEWKIITSPTLTMGTNGFTILKDGNTITDQSANSNDFTLGAGTLTPTEDNPSNVFCTLNEMNPYSGTLSNGNLKISQSSYDYNTQGTLGMVSGKYYWEVKMGGLHAEIGIAENSKAGQSDPQNAAGFRMIYSNGSGGVVVYNNATGSSSTTNSGWTNFAASQIIGVAYDADNGKLYFHNNGTYYNSGDPAGGTGAVISSISPQYAGVMVPFLGSGTSSARTHEINFGNGYFGTTDITSAGTNASNLGRFEYDVPTGYTALCTKGLNE